MTETLRGLERAHEEDPSDLPALERLQDERLRRGLGWYGEEMPKGVSVLREERGVYWFHPRPLTQGHFESALQMVYVPGGEVPCEPCKGRAGGHHGVFQNFRPCTLCGATGKRLAAPFFLGRYPVTNVEFRAFLFGRAPENPDQERWRTSHSGPDREPVVNVSLDDAKDFCSWGGLRLPSEQEWRWAALGAPLDCVNCSGGRHGALGGCNERQRSGRRFRSYPWSKPEDTIRENGPTPERCVWAAPREVLVELPCAASVRDGDSLAAGPDGAVYPTWRAAASAAVFGVAVGAPRFVPGNPGGYRVSVQVQRETFGGAATQAVVHEQVRIACGCGKTVAWIGSEQRSVAVNAICCNKIIRMDTEKRLTPARPKGASWCGAMDMAGNVWEWLSNNYAAGGSFRSQPEALSTVVSSHWFFGAPPSDGRVASDELGFRVALSAKS